MKKTIAAVIFIFLSIFSTIVSYASDTTKLFYNNEVHILKESIVALENEYFFDITELSSILEMEYTINQQNSSINIEFNGVRDTFTIEYFNAVHTDQVKYYNAPTYIDNKLYLPFSFIKNTYKFIIKYNRNEGSLYFFPRENTGNAQLTKFTNIAYDYSIQLSNRFSLYSGDSEYNFHEDIISVSDKQSKLSATITCDKLDNTTLKNMRLYLNDFSSKDDDIFQRFTEYKNSYFNAMQDYYKRDFLYNIDDEKSTESAMKVFKEAEEELFGQPANIVLYNSIKSQQYTSAEETNLNITLPVNSNRTIYSLNFTLPMGQLNASSINAIYELLNSIKIDGLPMEPITFNFLSDYTLVNSVNQGIYPDLPSSAVTYSTLENSKLGYKITYPSHFSAYRQNNIFSSYDYKSFKINYNQQFHIYVEPTYDEKNAINNKINFLKQLHNGKINIIDEGSVKFSENGIRYITYELTDAKGLTYIQDYFIVNNSMLFNIQLNSRFIKPSRNIQEMFLEIVKSLKFTYTNPIDYNNQMSFVKFTNNEEGYSLLYPSGWQISENISNDVHYDAFSIKNPDYSGPIEILVQEGELYSELPSTDIIKFVTGSSTAELKKYFKKYSSPYSNRIYRPLAYSSFTKNGATYLIKLVNYLDASNRGKLCYSIDIIRDKKIYSLFVLVSDYLTLDGSVFNDDLSSMLNFISNSFDLENSKSFAERKSKGEIRNRKIVLIENYLKLKLGNSAFISSSQYLEPTNDILVSVEGISECMYYRIKIDSSNKEIAVLESISKTDVLKTVIQEVTQQYKNTILLDVKPDPNNMTLLLKYKADEDFPIIEKQFQISAQVEDNSLVWKLSRKDISNALKNDCKNFLESYLLTHVDIEIIPQDNQNYNSNKFFTAVYAEFDGLSGYFVLEVDPLNNSIKVESYTPIEKMYDKVNRIYSLPSSDYSINNIGINKNNRFEIQVFLISKYNITYKLNKLKVTLDSNTNTLELK